MSCSTQASSDDLRVLVVEDEGAIALLIEDMLETLGCTVIGSAASVQEALGLVERGGFELAFLDINLAGERADPVAEELRRRDLPFAFISGYGPVGVREDLEPIVVIQKPFRCGDLEIAIRIVKYRRGLTH